MNDQLLEAPIECPLTRVNEDWIDYNGHMNMAYYLLVFDQGLDYIYDQIGIGEEYVRTKGGSCFTREVQVNYVEELVVGDPIRVTFQLLDWDSKRLHFIEEMFHAEQGYLVATAEQLAVHVDMIERKAAPFPEDIQALLDHMLDAHAAIPRPPQVGSPIGIRRHSC